MKVSDMTSTNGTQRTKINVFAFFKNITYTDTNGNFYSKAIVKQRKKTSSDLICLKQNLLIEHNKCPKDIKKRQ